MELKLAGTEMTGEPGVFESQEAPGAIINGVSAVENGNGMDVVPPSQSEQLAPLRQNGNGNVNGHESDGSSEPEDILNERADQFSTSFTNGFHRTVEPSRPPSQQQSFQHHFKFQSSPYTPPSSPALRHRPGGYRESSVPANFSSSRILNQRTGQSQPGNRSMTKFDFPRRNWRSSRQQCTYWVEDFFRWLSRRGKLDALLIMGLWLILGQLINGWRVESLHAEIAVLKKELSNSRHEQNQRMYLFETSVAMLKVNQHTMIQSNAKITQKIQDVGDQVQRLSDKMADEDKEEFTPASRGIFSSFGFGSVDDEKSRFMLDDELVDDAVIIRWRENAQDLKISYPYQTREFWTQLSAAVESTMSTDVPAKPASIVVLSKSTSDGSQALEFVNRLASSINTAFDPKFQDVKQLKVESISEAKSISHVHEDLKSYLNSKGKAVVVENIEDFRRTEHLFLFHAFCENSNQLAYDTRASFIFTMKPAAFVESQHEWTHWEGSRIVRESLQYKWRSALDDDKRDAVISRVCAYVVLFNDTDEDPNVV